MRGVEPVAFDVHRARPPRRRGACSGRSSARWCIGRRRPRARYVGARVGGEIEFGRRRWTVVGIFDAGGTAFDSEIWADVTDVQDDTRRDGLLRRPAHASPRARTARRSMRAHRGRRPLHARGEAGDRRTTREQADTAQLALRPRADARRRSWRPAPTSARSTRCTPRSRAGRPRSARCARSASAAASILGVFLGRVAAARGAAASSPASRSRALAMLAVNTLLSGVAVQHDDLQRGDRAPPSHSRRRPRWASRSRRAIGLLGGLAPAWRAARLRVVDALHRA